MASESKKDTAYSEPEYAKSTKKPTDYPWYSLSIDKYLIPQTRKLLEEYAKVPQEDQSKHVHDIVWASHLFFPNKALLKFPISLDPENQHELGRIDLNDSMSHFPRDQAWAIRSYPCTGLGVWLVPYIPRNQAYSTIVSDLKSGATLLDIGCFLGSDLRQLVYDGAPSDKMYAVDIVSHWDVGFKLYNDKETFKARFIEADITKPNESEDLMALKSKMDIISISAVLHQWSLEKQIEVCKTLVDFSKKGTLVIGYQIGNFKAQNEMNLHGTPQWKHDPSSFKKMWDDVGLQTGTKWETTSEFIDWDQLEWDTNDVKWMKPEDRPLHFVVKRVE